MATRKKGQLMVAEEAFIDAYISNGYKTRDAVITAKIASSNPARKGLEILNRPIVAKEVAKRLQARTIDLFINETLIMNQLWQEASLKGPGSTQTGRVQALLALGKHIGMFNSHKAVGEAGDKGTTINIVNYNGAKEDTGTIVDTSPVKEIVQEIKESPKIEGVKIRKFDA